MYWTLAQRIVMVSRTSQPLKARTSRSYVDPQKSSIPKYSPTHADCRRIHASLLRSAFRLPCSCTATLGPAYIRQDNVMREIKLQMVSRRVASNVSECSTHLATAFLTAPLSLRNKSERQIWADLTNVRSDINTWLACTLYVVIASFPTVLACAHGTSSSLYTRNTIGALKRHRQTL